MASATSEFSITRGGPLYRFAEGVGMGRKPQTRAAVVSLVAWVPLLMLSLIEGTATGHRGALFDDAQVWVRCLFSLPLLVLAEPLVDSRIGESVSALLRSTLLGPAERPAFEEARRRLQRGLDLWWAEAIMVVIAVAAAWTGQLAAIVPGAHTWRSVDFGETTRVSMAATWYMLVSAPLSTLLLMRWVWRLALWTAFLLRLARMPLPLVPAHPDRAGGLEVLCAAHIAFAPVVLAVSAVMAAGIDNRVRLLGTHVMDYQVVMIIVVVVLPALFLAPLVVFTPWLAAARRHYLHDYSVTGSRMGAAWQRRWMNRTDSIPEQELGSPEIQSYSDFTNIYEHASETRLAPITSRIAIALLLSAALPMAVVMATERPIGEILKMLHVFM